MSPPHPLTDRLDLPDGDPDEFALVAAARSAQLTFSQPEWDDDDLTLARSFISTCMTADADRRPTAAAAARHAWFAPPTRHPTNGATRTALNGHAASLENGRPPAAKLDALALDAAATPASA